MFCKVSPMPTTASRPPAKSAASKAAQPADAKRAAIAKAKATAPHVAARIGSTPKTKFRGNPDLFGRLVEDHDRHRALLAMIGETSGKSPDRKKLFRELTLELKSHAAAEEQALWSSVMRNPATTDDARHAVAEHKAIDDMLADLAARDMASPGWLRRFAALREESICTILQKKSRSSLWRLKSIFQPVTCATCSRSSTAAKKKKKPAPR